MENISNTIETSQNYNNVTITGVVLESNVLRVQYVKDEEAFETEVNAQDLLIFLRKKEEY
jgi:hypothetical protein